MKTISRDELKAKMDQGDYFILLEALGEASYRQAHLPGAIRLRDTGHVPDLFPDKSTEIIAYCSDFN